MERYREIVRSLFCTIIYLGMIGIAAVLVFNADFVKLWVGADFYGGDILNVLICTYALMKILRITLYKIMLSRYEIRVTSLASMAEATIQVGAGVIFAFIWGVNGVVLASIVAVTIASVIQGKALLPILRFRVEHTTLKIVRLFSIVALPSGLVILVERLWATDSWAKLLLYATGYAIVGAILIVCAEPRLFVQIKNILQRKPVGV